MMKMRTYLNSPILKFNDLPIFFGFLLFLLGCNHSENYKYSEGVFLYLDFLGVDPKKDQTILLIPYGECSLCIEPAIDFLKLNDPSVDLVIITQEFHEGYQRTEDILFDASGRFKLYETGIFAPVIFKIENGKVKGLFRLRASTRMEFEELIEGYTHI
jgi:hypothetical protein